MICWNKTTTLKNNDLKKNWAALPSLWLSRVCFAKVLLTWPPATKHLNERCKSLWKQVSSVWINIIICGVNWSSFVSMLLFELQQTLSNACVQPHAVMWDKTNNIKNKTVWLVWLARCSVSTLHYDRSFSSSCDTRELFNRRCDEV